MSTRRTAAALAVAALIAVATACAPEPGTPGTWVQAGCIDGAGTDGNAAPDLRYSGTPNQVGNAVFFARISGGTFSLSGDGTCSGLPVGAITIVRAANQAAADLTCTGLGQGTATSFTGSPWTLPSDAWSCSATVTL